MQDILSTAHKLADAAGEVIRGHFRTPFEVIAKADETPVTVADRAVEARLREMIGAAFPNDGILGEEYGEKPSQNGRTWVIDPIDGTKSFIIGRPTFGTLIALCEDGVPIMGVIDQPILKERWVGAKGMQTTFNGQPVKTRPCGSLKEAICASTSPAQLISAASRNDTGGADGPKDATAQTTPHLWQRLYAGTKAMVWGGDCYSYGLLSMGGLDLVIEQYLAPYDFAALAPIVEGAGGWMGDWEGKSLTLQSDGRTIALGDAALKDAVLKFIHH